MSSWAARMVAYCAGQPRAEQQRVVGAERDGRARGEQRAAAAPRSGRSRRRAPRWRPGRPRAATPASTIRSSSAGSSAARTPWPSRSACRSSRQTRTCSGPRSSPPCGTSISPARSAICERRGEVARCVPRRSSLERPKPTTPRPAYCAGEPGERAGVQRVPGPVGRDDDGHAEPGRGRRLADRVEDQVGERGDAAEAGGVPARVDLDLQPPAAVADVVLGGLPHQPAYVVLGAQHRPGDVVEPLEAEPALLVGGRQLRRPVLDQRVGQRRCRPARRARAASRAASTP